MIMSGIAYFVRNWRYLQLVLFSPLVLVVALFYWSALFLFFFSYYRVKYYTYSTERLRCCVSFRFLPESARWLITQGRRERAIKEIRKAAKVNGREVSQDFLDKVIELLLLFGQNHTKERMTLTPNLLHSSLDRS